MIEENDNTLTPLHRLGEFGLINRIKEGAESKHAQTIMGIGDDAAVLDSNGKRILVSSDLLTEGIHFDLAYMPLKHLGYKSAIVNFSDMYAMNAEPAQLFLNIALPSKFTVEAVEEFYRGVHLACKTYGVELAGGDTCSTLGGLTISATVIGYAQDENIVYRSGAKNGDLICVSGDLGASYAGLKLLEREKAVFKENPNVQPDLEGYDYILQRHLKPEARKDIFQLFKGLNIRPTAMMDISDGLASEINHICQASKCGAHMYLNRIPIDPSAASFLEEISTHPAIAALNGGEDYELLFTISQDDFSKIEKNPDISIIGYIHANQGIIQIETPDGRVSDVMEDGWNAFKN